MKNRIKITQNNGDIALLNLDNLISIYYSEKQKHIVFSFTSSMTNPYSAKVGSSESSISEEEFDRITSLLKNFF